MLWMSSNPFAVGKDFSIVLKAGVMGGIQAQTFLRGLWPLPLPNIVAARVQLSFPVAQLVKNLPAMWETWVWFLGWEDPRRRERLPIPVFWPGEFHGLYSPWSHKESDTTEPLSLTHSGSNQEESTVDILTGKKKTELIMQVLEGW